MSDRNAIAQRVDSLRRRWLDLTLAGRVLGGRPGEATMRVAAWDYDGETLRIDFDGGERLTVRRPAGVSGGAGVLSIRWAAEVRLTWPAHAPPAPDADRREAVSEVVCAATHDAPPEAGDAVVVRVTVSGPARESWSPQGVHALRPGEALVHLA